MSYPDDPRDLSALGKKKTSGYSSEYDPNPDALPDVRPPGGTTPAPVPQQQTQIPAPRQTLTPEQIQARNIAIQRQQAAAAQANSIALTPQQPQPTHQQPAPAPAPAPAPVQPAVPVQQNLPPQQQQVATPAAPARPQHQQPAKAPQPQKKAAPKPQAKKAPSSVLVGEERPARPKIDKDKLDFVSGSELEGTSTRDKLLDTSGLVKIYDGRTVVNGVEINVGKGEIVGLLGPNGAGKTTSFYMIVGLVPPNGGRVVFNGIDVTKMPMYKRARLGMGYLPQEESIFRKLTVEENLMAVMQTMKYSRKEKKQRCEELLERFSITHIRKNMAMACSGGEKRRVTIARSLVPNPSLIMLDEPFAGVDPIAVNEIQGIVQDLREDGLAILLTDHNARQTLELVDRAYLIYEGRVLREGSRDFLVNDPMSRELYLGDSFSM